MFSFILAIVTAISIFSRLSIALDTNLKSNVAVYWGQGPYQERLLETCKNSDVDIVIVSFINVFPDNAPGGYPGSNFGNQCGAEVYKNGNVDTKLLSNCPLIGPDITECQKSFGKKVLLSLGGGYPTDYYLESTTSAQSFASFLWGAFGPVTSAWTNANRPRPFGDAVVDGFDLDIESFMATPPKDKSGNEMKDYQNRNYDVLVNYLKNTLFPRDVSKQYYISSAPQCLTPDSHLSKAIENSWFDFIFLQFYNTPQCSARAGVDKLNGKGSNDISFAAWNTHKSLNPNVKVYLGLPANIKNNDGRDNTYYLTPSEVYQLTNSLINKYSRFGGIMVWEAQFSKNNAPCGTEYASWMKTVAVNCAAGKTMTFTCPTTTSTATPTPTGGLSPNGLCGQENGYTCKGSAFGRCCSKYGYCGATDEYCGSANCDPKYGECGPASSSSSSSRASSTSTTSTRSSTMSTRSSTTSTRSSTTSMRTSSTTSSRTSSSTSSRTSSTRTSTTLSSSSTRTSTTLSPTSTKISTTLATSSRTSSRTSTRTSTTSVPTTSSTRTSTTSIRTSTTNSSTRTSTTSTSTRPSTTTTSTRTSTTVTSTRVSTSSTPTTSSTKKITTTIPTPTSSKISVTSATTSTRSSTVNSSTRVSSSSSSAVYPPTTSSTRISSSSSTVVHPPTTTSSSGPEYPTTTSKSTGISTTSSTTKATTTTATAATSTPSSSETSKSSSVVVYPSDTSSATSYTSLSPTTLTTLTTSTSTSTSTSTISSGEYPSQISEASTAASDASSGTAYPTESTAGTSTHTSTDIYPTGYSTPSEYLSSSATDCVTTTITTTYVTVCPTGLSTLTTTITATLTGTAPTYAPTAWLTTTAHCPACGDGGSYVTLILPPAPVPTSTTITVVTVVPSPYPSSTSYPESQHQAGTDEYPEEETYGDRHSEGEGEGEYRPVVGAVAHPSTATDMRTYPEATKTGWVAPEYTGAAAALVNGRGVATVIAVAVGVWGVVG